MNKQKIREILRHGKALKLLAGKCDVAEIDVPEMMVKLHQLENRAHRITEQLCNGEIEEQKAEKALKRIAEKVDKIFAYHLQGFFINYDPRGYALKIQSETMKEVYSDIGLKTDWGGYGILSPEIN